MNVRAIVLAGALLGAPHAALAHGDVEHVASVAALPWSSDWLSWTCLGLSLALYVRGYPRLHRASSGAQRPRHLRDAVCFMAGWMVLAVALVSPLHPWGQLLFSAHMIQHELLMLVAAPLLVLGHPALAFTHALPPRLLVALFSRTATTYALRPAWRAITTPLGASVLHAVALWIWHVPRLFEATLHSELVHAAQHASFFVSALLFWWALLRRESGRHAYGAAVLYLFATAGHSGALGALITLARHVVYPAYESTAPAWGLSAMEDQQLGGLVMWIPAGVLYAGVAIAMLAFWLSDDEERQQMRERASLHGLVAPRDGAR